jgi:nicotinate-nucleotide pyrophosphorylase (carboxylating)
MDDGFFEELLRLALEEDLGDRGDVTSQAIFGRDDGTSAVLVSKDSGVLCGSALFKRTFAAIDPDIDCELLREDGSALKPGDEVARLEGRTIPILKGERTAINFLGFLSGIATKSREFQEKAFASGKAIVLDTRKTLPGYRALSKYAVRTGGARNHRMGLHDMVLIKDNHQDAAGGIEEAVARVRAAWGSSLRIEVEARSVADVEKALGLGVDWIMLDNMGEADCAKAIALPRRKDAPPVVFEASGNMDLDKVGRFSALGVDRISVGALTHSVRTFDFSLRIGSGRAGWPKRKFSTSW